VSALAIVVGRSASTVGRFGIDPQAKTICNRAHGSCEYTFTCDGSAEWYFLSKLKKNEDSRSILFWENSMRGLVAVWQVNMVRGKELQGNICDVTLLRARWVSYSFW
jgi:hypothetical protein